MSLTNRATDGLESNICSNEIESLNVQNSRVFQRKHALNVFRAYVNPDYSESDIGLLKKTTGYARYYKIPGLKHKRNKSFAPGHVFPVLIAEIRLTFFFVIPCGDKQETG